MRSRSIRVNRPCWLVRIRQVHYCLIHRRLAPSYLLHGRLVHPAALIIFIFFFSTLFIPSVDALTLQEVFPHLLQDKYKALTEGKAVFLMPKLNSTDSNIFPNQSQKRQIKMSTHG